MKTVIVYDRVNKWGGAERVLLALHELFPDASLYTSVYDPEKASWAKVFPKVIPSFLQKIPFAKKNHEFLAPLMPLAFETFDFSEFDLVISVTSEAAKGIITKPSTKHICYCLTPTRYLWSHYDEYFKDAVIKSVAKPVVEYLRCWDKIAAQRPDAMIAISTAVQRRIKKYYDRESEIIYPPVDVERIKNCESRIKKNRDPSASLPPSPKLRRAGRMTKKQILKPVQDDMGGFFLVVSRLVAYKKVDLVIRAFNELGYPLVIIGTGKEEGKLKSMAGGNITFTKNLTDRELVNYYSKARVLIMPQIEDFGLVAVEAQTAGTPVIAYKAGGVLDTVIDGETGVFFDKQNVSSLISAIKKFEKTRFDKKRLVGNAKRFSKERFKKEFQKLVDDV